MRFKQTAKKLAATFGMVSAIAALAACSSQKFGIPEQSREFTQKVSYSTTLDVLWVIDTSTSMSQHQSLLADQVGGFLDSLNSTGLDYQMAVTTMDMSASGAKGRFVAQAGTPVLLKSTTPNLTQVLSTRLKVGDNGSPTERGLEAMKAALSEPLKNGANAGFLRDNSLLVVIFLTNEEDKSATADYVAWLDQLRPPLPLGDRSWLAHFMGVTPDDPNCKTSAWGFSSPGTRYIELAKQSTGVVESICDADLRRALTNAKARVLEVATEYVLGRAPRVDTIRVVVDGVVVPQSETDGWSYYAPNLSIRFRGNSVPKAGASIRVDFDPAAPK